MCLSQSQDMNIQYHMFWYFLFVQSYIVEGWSFVFCLFLLYIGGVVYHHSLDFLFIIMNNKNWDIFFVVKHIHYFIYRASYVVKFQWISISVNKQTIESCHLSLYHNAIYPNNISKYCFVWICIQYFKTSFPYNNRWELYRMSVSALWHDYSL